MICVSLIEPSYERLIDVLEGLEMAEIRMDGANLTPEQVKSLFSQPLALVATFRPGRVGLEKRKEMLSLAIRSGARFVDLELESPPEFKDELVRIAKKSHCQVIISYHNDKETPDCPFLENIIAQCFEAGADIAKLACMVHSKGDCARLLSLYDHTRPVIVIGMGPLGTITRIISPLLGAPFTYASLTPQKKTAEGQLDWKTLQKKIRTLSGC